MKMKQSDFAATTIALLPMLSGFFYMNKVPLLDTWYEVKGVEICILGLQLTNGDMFLLVLGLE